MSEYLDTTRETLEYEIEVEPKVNNNANELSSILDSACLVFEKMLDEKTQALQSKIEKLEYTFKVFTGRELEIAKLKEKISFLENQRT